MSKNIGWHNKGFEAGLAGREPLERELLLERAGEDGARRYMVGHRRGKERRELLHSGGSSEALS